MHKFVVLSAAGFMALALPSPSVAQEQTTCSSDAQAVLPTELSGWTDRQPLQAGQRENTLSAATLQVGKGVDAQLARTPDVKYPVRPEKPGGSVSYGGLFAFTVEQTGTYRVALGSGAWIDIVKGTAVIESSAHGRGPDCTGVRKMVDFVLEPGLYTLQIAANGQADLPLLVTRLP